MEKLNTVKRKNIAGVCGAIKRGIAYRVNLLEDPRLPMGYKQERGIVICEENVCPYGNRGEPIDYCNGKTAYICIKDDSVFGTFH